MSIFDLFKKRKKIYRPWAKYYTDEQLNVKIPNSTMYNQVVLTRDNYPNGIALEYFGKKFTYKWLVRKVDRCYLSFKKMGINKGDIVTLCMPNVPNVLIALYALNKIGAIANMLHPLSAEEEIKDYLNKTNSVLMICYSAFYNKIKSIINETSVYKVIFASPSDSMPVFLTGL
jgi:long-chain acyl-CoA synthetase